MFVQQNIINSLNRDIRKRCIGLEFKKIYIGCMYTVLQSIKSTILDKFVFFQLRTSYVRGAGWNIFITPLA